MSQATITLIILAVAITLFIVDKFPMGLVAFCVPPTNDKKFNETPSGI